MDKKVKLSMGGGISVIVPVYNGEKYIKNCLDMLLNQDGENFEVIVINDGSTDNTADIVKSIRDEKLVYFEQEKNKGLSTARNIGMNLSRGDWILFCDVDDEVKPGYIADICEQIEAFPDYDVFCYAKSHVKSEWNNNDLYDISNKQALLGTVSGNKSATFKFFNDYFIGGAAWSKVYRKEFLKNCLLTFNEKIQVYGEDVIFLLKVFTLAKKIKLVHRGFYVYVQNFDSIVHSIGRESEIEGYVSSHLEILNFIDKKDNKGLWKDDELIKAMNNFLINHANTCISRVLRAMMKNGRTVAEKRKALSEMKQARNELRNAVGKRFVFNVNSIKVFIADNFPILYIRLMEKRWKND